MTICRIGFCNPDFTFQGLGGRKMIGQGWIFTVDNDKLYVMPNSVFHYFYVHRIAPSKKFHLCGWNHDYAPNLADFIIKVNFMYCFIQNLMDTINMYIYAKYKEFIE